MIKSQENTPLRFEIEVIRSRRRTMCLSVTREGRVVVRSPLTVSDAEISVFVRKHIRWISKRLQEREGELSLVDGARLPLMGELYTIETGTRAKLSEGILYLPAQNREGALIQLLKKISLSRMQGFLDVLCERYGYRYSALSITSARGRWGSCNSKKKICFSFRVAFLPDSLAEYLAVHELCHTRYLNHGVSFWRAVSLILPDCLERRKGLKSYLWVMNIL